MLYDAVALLIADSEASTLASVPAARDFVADAFAHCKFIGHVAAASALFTKAGVDEALDEGCVALDGRGGVTAFLQGCRLLRFWEREAVTPQSDKRAQRSS